VTPRLWATGTTADDAAYDARQPYGLVGPVVLRPFGADRVR
jgi:hypothetical protein